MRDLLQKLWDAGSHLEEEAAYQEIREHEDWDKVRGLMAANDMRALDRLPSFPMFEIEPDEGCSNDYTRYGYIGHFCRIASHGKMFDPPYPETLPPDGGS